MRPTIPLLLAACLITAGCGGLRRSPSWEKVIAVRVDTRDSADPSAAYAEQLSSALKAEGIEHKVITYEFRYRTRLREEAIETRSAVLYRDEGSTRHPWWLADAHSSGPVWLPGEDLERQIEFYLHKPATILSVNGAPASGEGKRQIADPGQQSPSFLARLWPLQKGERSRKFAPAAAPTTLPAKFSEQQLALFRVRHGSQFDPASVIDRLKMERLLEERGRLAAR